MTIKTLENVTEWPETTIVCNCKQTPLGKIKEAVRLGCRTLDEITEKTQAAIGCSFCKPILNKIIETTPRDETSTMTPSQPRLQKYLGWVVVVKKKLKPLFYDT